MPRNDPEATYGLERLSGALVWSDENYLEFVATRRRPGNLKHWELVAYRSSWIRGCPRADARRGWEEVRGLVPQWPGFRLERSCESLRAILEQALASEDAAG